MLLILSQSGPTVSSAALGCSAVSLVGSVCQTRFRRGNDMAFIITGTGTRTAEAFEGGVATAPLLHVE
jgi:hypothetical protein